ncbi:MAG: hypothetical protein K0V04_17520 [Deltaproteobacteria bacterium]|nr:hypothetical protein [Deltaproteobacteria bacterium]
MKRAIKTTMALLAVAIGATACAPRYDGFDCRMLNETPTAALCTDSRIEVARGEALVVRISPVSESRTEFDDNVTVELRTGDNQRLDVRPGAGEEFALIGLTVGETITEVWIDGELEDEIVTRIIAADPSGPSD